MVILIDVLIDILIDSLIDASIDALIDSLIDSLNVNGNDRNDIDIDFLVVIDCGNSYKIYP
jgi:hypothetical protein